MRARIHVHRAVIGAVLVAVLAGCASTPAEELRDWWDSGGDRSTKALSQTSGRVNEVSVRPMDVWGEACQELLAEVAKAKKLGTIPSDDARSFWNDALVAFEHGGGECVAGTQAKDEPRASEGIREVQKGISRLASAVSLIRGDLEGH